MKDAIISLFGFALFIGLPIAGIALVNWAVDSYCNSLPPTAHAEKS